MRVRQIDPQRIVIVGEFSAMFDRFDLVPAMQNSFRKQESRGELEIVADRPHGDRNRPVSPPTPFKISEPDFERFLDSDLILIEANYDDEMLNRSPRLDRGRVGSNVGHFSNAQAGKFLVRVLQESRKSPQAVVLCHLSADHNTPELARRTVRGILSDHRFGDVPVHAARREGPSRKFTV